MPTAPVIRYYDDIYPVTPRDHGEIAALGSGAYDPATEDGRTRLHRLLERQNYRLAWWGTAGDEINWRRPLGGSSLRAAASRSRQLS